MKILYTDSALSELEKFTMHRKEDLESLIKRQKYVFGDETIEITASDIRDAEKSFARSHKVERTLPLTKLLLRMYAILGVASILAAIFYQDLMEIIYGNPLQRVLLLGGFVLTLFSVVGGYLLRLRQSRRDELERRYQKFEKVGNSKVEP